VFILLSWQELSVFFLLFFLAFFFFLGEDVGLLDSCSSATSSVALRLAFANVVVPELQLLVDKIQPTLGIRD
jgi:hypothetical protein